MTTWETAPFLTAESLRLDDGPPVFAELAASWAAFGRMVPGRPDAEWDRLVAGGPGKRRRIPPSWVRVGAA